MRNNHPSRNWRHRMRDAADAAAVKLAEKRARENDWPVADRLLATIVAREAYMLGYEVGDRK